MPKTMPAPHPLARIILAWMVHLFTASGSVVGLLSLVKTYQGDYVAALWLIGASILIDAVDGSLARLARVKTYLPGFDGALLDNIVDYLNYVITPCFFLYLKPGMLPAEYALCILGLVCLCSCYQFCQSDAKTPDHFFKGFPCQWSTMVFLMFVLNTSMLFNTAVLLLASVMIFVPIKYVYPSRLDYLTNSRWMKMLMHLLGAMYGLSYCMILWQYPERSPVWLGIALAYVIFYLVFSFYRTCFPLQRELA